METEKNGLTSEQEDSILEAGREKDFEKKSNQKDYNEASGNYEAVKHSLSEPEIKDVSNAQEDLIVKLLKSSKLRDKEYRMLREILDNKVLTSYDASIFIGHVLGLVKFRRHFFNGRHKAYKKCYFCKSRENVERYSLATDPEKKDWVCEECALNLLGKVVPVKSNEKETSVYESSLGLKFVDGHLLDESNELMADLARKYPEDSNVELEK